MDFPKPILYHFKHADLPFELEKFFPIYSMNDVKTFLEVFNNVDHITLIVYGGLFLSVQSPLWKPESTTYSYILPLYSYDTIGMIWKDLSRRDSPLQGWLRRDPRPQGGHPGDSPLQGGPS